MYAILLEKNILRKNFVEFDFANEQISQGCLLFKILFNFHSHQKDGEIAFIGFTTPVDGLLSRTQEGKSNR